MTKPSSPNRSRKKAIVNAAPAIAATYVPTPQLALKPSPGFPRITSSKLYLAELCPGSHALPHQRESSAAANTGTKGHSFLERVLLGDLEGARELAPDELKDRLDGIDLKRLVELFGTFEPNVEQAFAYNPREDQARVLGERMERDYSKVTSDEIAGTADGWSGDSSWAVVADWKFGRSYVAHPRENWQVKFFVVSISRITGAEVVRGIIGKVDEDGGTKFFFEDFDTMAIDAIAHGIRRIEQRVRASQMAVEDGRRPELVVGEHCGYCPARWACPAIADAGQQLVALEARAAALTPEAAGFAYLQVQAVMKAGEAVKKVLLSRAKAEPLPLPNGKVLKIFPERLDVLDFAVALEQATEAEKSAVMKAADISKAALERELGKDASIALFERMKSANGIKDGVRLMPRQVNPPAPPEAT